MGSRVKLSGLLSQAWCSLLHKNKKAPPSSSAQHALPVEAKKLEAAHRRRKSWWLWAAGGAPRPGCQVTPDHSQTRVNADPTRRGLCVYTQTSYLLGSPASVCTSLSKDKVPDGGVGQVMLKGTESGCLQVGGTAGLLCAATPNTLCQAPGIGG